MTVVETIRDTIRFWTDTSHPDRIRRDWSWEPHQINRGMCGKFADQIAARCNEVEKAGTYMEKYGDDSFPDHMWVTDGNKHYDAEAPEGVEDWRDLPFFKKRLKR